MVIPVTNKAGVAQAQAMGTSHVIQELDKQQKSQTQDAGAKSVAGRSLVKQIISTNNSSKIGMDLVAELTSKMAASGIQLYQEEEH